MIAAKNAAMHEVADLLAQTGDVVSEAGLANLANWKHGAQTNVKNAVVRGDVGGDGAVV